jgi:hypothetical protein
MSEELFWGDLRRVQEGFQVFEIFIFVYYERWWCYGGKNNFTKVSAFSLLLIDLSAPAAFDFQCRDPQIAPVPSGSLMYLLAVQILLADISSR